MNPGNPVQGMAYVYRGLQLLREPGIRRFAVGPVLASAAVLACSIALGFGWLQQQMEQKLSSVWEWILWPLIFLATVVLVWLLFATLTVLVGMPFNGLLAEAVERRLTGQAPPAASTFWPIVWRSLRDEVHKLGYFVVRALPLVVCTWLPVIQWLALPLWLLFSVWVLALEYMDYPLANHGVVFAEQRALLRSRPALFLGFGSGILLLFAIPLLGLLAMPAAVAGATLLYHEQLGPDARDPHLRPVGAP